MTELQLRHANSLWSGFKWDTLKIAEHFGVHESVIYNYLTAIRRYTPEARRELRAI